MKITRKQLRKIISEHLYDGRPIDPMTRIADPDMRARIQDLKKDSPEQANMLASTLQEPDLVIPFEGEPYEELAFQGDDYDEDLRKYEAKNITKIIKRFLPNFDKLEMKYQRAMIEFINSEDQTIFLSFNEPAIDDYLAEMFPITKQTYDMNKWPTEAVEEFNDFNFPKTKPAEFYYLYALTSKPFHSGLPSIFGKVDPHGEGDAQAGLHDGFIANYVNVSGLEGEDISVDHAIIRMLRHVLPGIKEEPV